MRGIVVASWLVLGMAGCGGAVAAIADAATTDAGVGEGDAATPGHDAGAADATIDSTPPCNAPLSRCNGVCVDLSSDQNNCGTCGASCGPALMCKGASCRVNCAASGFTECGGTCVDLLTDVHNCGSCAKACSAGWWCSNGTCGTDCGGGPATLCSGVDGGSQYCANLNVDNANCGQCGRACSPGSVCSGGQCSCGCPPPDTCCALDGGALYCVNTQNDNLNCGLCGNTCPPGSVCSQGRCSCECEVGFINCGNLGCLCVDPMTDDSYCGASGDCLLTPGTKCVAPATCVKGTCK
jgi:hypothetical protein